MLPAREKATLLPSFDQSVSALIEDLYARGLNENVLFVFCGEFGRTPLIRNQDASGRPGRDHWPRAMSIFLSGGGLNMGQVIGKSDKTAGKPATEPLGPKNLLATVMQTLFDAGQLRVQRGLPTELVKLVEENRPIPGLLT